MPLPFTSLPHERTLARSVAISGVGLHSGVMVSVVLEPAKTRRGLIFRRTDLETSRTGPIEIPAIADNVVDVDHATTLAVTTAAGRATVQTVEHLMAALAGSGIDHATILLDGPEVPVLDGSSLPWLALLSRAGTRAISRSRRVRRMTGSLTVERGAASISIVPSSIPRVTCSIDFAHRTIGRQEITLDLTPARFAAELAEARTFGFMHEIEALRAAGLVRGGSIDNAIVLDEHGPLNGLRSEDEFVRHKALDLVGDLALTGMPILGHVTAHRAGHRLHVEFARELLARPDLWTIETIVPEREEAVRQPVFAAAGMRISPARD